MISDDGVPVDACPRCGVLLRDRPGQRYCPTGDYVVDLPDVPYPDVDETIRGIRGY